MSDFMGRVMSKLIALLAVVLFIVALRESILTDESVGSAFSAILSTLPFGKLIAESICSVLKIDYKIPDLTANGVFTDIINLLIMACIRPIAGRIFTRIFLQMPSGLSSQQMEDFMGRASYRIREVLVTVIFAPLIAFFVAYLSKRLMDYISVSFGMVVSILLKTLLGLVAGGISISVLAVAGMGLGAVLSYRIFVTLGMSVLNTFITNVFSIYIYISFTRGISADVATGIVLVAVWLIIAETATNWITKGIARRNLR